MILTCFLDNQSLSTLPYELHETYLKNLVIHKTPHERSAKEATRQLFLSPSFHSNLLLFSICVLENDTIRIDFDWLSHQQPAFCYACRQHPRWQHIDFVQLQLFHPPFVSVEATVSNQVSASCKIRQHSTGLVVLAHKKKQAYQTLLVIHQSILTLQRFPL